MMEKDRRIHLKVGSGTMRELQKIFKDAAVEQQKPEPQKFYTGLGFYAEVKKYFDKNLDNKK